MKTNLKLLIVEDNAGDRVLIQEAMETAGLEFEVIIAHNGEDGIEKAKQLRAEDIVILDTRLPGMDGFETCQKIKEVTEGVKVIICTGLIDAVDAGTARTVGADDYCVKTSDGGPLIHAVRNILGLK